MDLQTRRASRGKAATHREEREYSLNRPRALKKKALSCLNDVKVNHEIKGSNHIFTMSTAMYELYKMNLIAFCDQQQNVDASQSRFVVKHIHDIQNTLAETQVKVHHKTQRVCGRTKYTLNLYHTTNRVLANGKNAGAFCADHKHIVKKYMWIVMKLNPVINSCIVQ